MCRWNQLDVAIVLLSLTGIVLEEMKSGVIPINPTIIRVMRVLRIARGDSDFWKISCLVLTVFIIGLEFIANKLAGDY